MADLVPGARLVDFPTKSDARGSLTIAEAGLHLPFVPRRVRWTYGVPAQAQRGGHAHRATEQLFVAMSGRVEVVIDDGSTSAAVRLDTPTRGLYVPPLVWVETGPFSPDAVFLILSSTGFDEADYVRDLETLRTLRAAG